MDDISYLFAVEAEQFLMAGMAEEAIQLCNRGLEVFPGYAAAVSVLAQAHKALGQKDIAIQIIDEAKENIPATSVNYILETLDNSNVEYNSSPKKNYVDPHNDDAAEEINQENEEDYEIDIISQDEEKENSEQEQELLESEIIIESQDEYFEDSNIINGTENINEEKISYQQPTYEKISFSSNLDIIPGLEKLNINKAKMIFGGSKIHNIDKFQKIAKQHSNFISIMNSLENAAPIKPEISIKKENRNAPVMITDTIAGILFQQGAFIEAKKAYSELSQKYPNKSDFYKTKISEIDIKLKG